MSLRSPATTSAAVGSGAVARPAPKPISSPSTRTPAAIAAIRAGLRRPASR
jgi:hypothetical protein